MNVIVDDDQVIALPRIAEQLADMFGWKEHAESSDVIYFRAGADGGDVGGRIDLSGRAYDADTGERLDMWDVDWGECFDGWSDMVWARDANGNAVMIHN